jgi:5-methylcytosine-specific restriction endonuclease McrA
MLYKGRAEVVELYSETMRAISKEVARSLQLSKTMLSWFEMSVDSSNPDVYVVRLPAVIRLLKTVGRKKVVKFSRINVYTRDNYTCQYCGKRKLMEDLNYDHIVPRSQGGTTVWENIATACYICNGLKRNRTPEQAGMTLLHKPVRPKSLPIAALRLESVREIPELWHSWLYWNAELQP